MKYLNTYESFGNNRISIDLDGYINLTKTGFIMHDGEKIEIDPDDFEKLIEGEVIHLPPYQICLQDIGYDQIFKYLSKSDIYSI